MSKRIITFEQGLLKTKEVVPVEAPKQKQLKKGRNYKAVNRTTYAHFEKVFHDNELNAYDKNTKTDKQIKDEFLRKNRDYTTRRRFETYKETIGNLRSKYNRNILLTSQAPVYLISLYYDEFSIIIVDSRQYMKYMSFEDVYDRCVEFKIGDPRFIPPTLLQNIRDRINSGVEEWLDWKVPPADWVKRFERRIGREAYNSVHFPQGWTREDAEAIPGEPNYFSE